MDGEAYRGLLERSLDLVTVIDERGVVQYENAAVERLLGYEPDARVGTDAFEPIHPEDRLAVWETFQSVVTAPGERTDRIEFRYRTADGGYRWLESLASNDRDTAIGGYVITSRDIQPRKDAERRSRQQERRLALLAEQTEDVLWLTDAAFEELLFVNDRFADVFGVAVETVAADPRQFVEAVHPEDRPAVRSALSTLVDGEAVEMEYRVGPPDYDRWVRVRGKPVRDEAGTAYRLAGFARDVTDRHEREHRLQRRNETLTLLTRVLGHEIRNDMSVVLGWLETVRPDVPPESRRAIDRAVEASDHVVEVAASVRALVSLESGDGTLPAGPTDLDEVLATVVERVRSTYPHATVEGPTFEWPGDGASGESAGDGGDARVRTTAGPLVRVALRNLLNNAVQHNDRDSPAVTVTARVSPTPDGGTVEVCVADDGPGVPDDRKTAAFEWSAGAPEDPTTGVGLHLVSRVVEAHGGDVWLTDRDPRGTVAHVELPLASGRD